MTLHISRVFDFSNSHQASLRYSVHGLYLIGANIDWSSSGLWTRTKCKGHHYRSPEIILSEQRSFFAQTIQVRPETCVGSLASDDAAAMSFTVDNCG